DAEGAIWAERHAPHRARVSVEGTHPGALLDVPERDAPLVVTAQGDLPVRPQRDADDAPRVVAQRNALIGVGIQEMEASVVASDGRQTGPRGSRDGADRLADLFDRREFRRLVEIPDRDRLVDGAAQKPPSVCREQQNGDLSQVAIEYAA